MESINKIVEKRIVLTEERDRYKHDIEDREIDRRENELNQLVQLRNNKKSIYDSKNNEINKLNDLEQAIKDLCPGESVDEDSL